MDGHLHPTCVEIATSFAWYKQRWARLPGTAALFCASQGLLALLYAWSRAFGGFRYDFARAGSARFHVPIAAYPWATWTAFLLAMAVFPLVWETLVARDNLSGIGFRSPSRPLREVVFAAFSTALFLAAMTIGLRIAKQGLPHTLALGNALFFSIQFGVIAAGEETLYRGVLQRRLSGILSLLPGIVLSSAVWAFVGHVRQPALQNLIIRFPVGLLLGYIYVRSKSLYPAMLAHWLLDMAVTVGF